MKRVIRFVARIYPRAWRQRYGEEFEALLEDTGADWRVVLDVLTGAMSMRGRQWLKIGASALAAALTVPLASWWIGQRPRITPGAHQIFYMDSTPGAMLEFLLLLVAVVAVLIALMLKYDGAPQAAMAALRVSAGVVLGYIGVATIVSLLSPSTIINIGDSYCWDLWCVGIQNVNTAPQGDNTLYTAEVSIFADSSTEQRVPADGAKQFFYVLDDQGHRYPILWDESLVNANVTVKPGESVKSSLAFLAPSNARKLYLTGDMSVPLWVRLYLGSDIAPFHRRTLLRVL